MSTGQIPSTAPHVVIYEGRDAQPLASAERLTMLTTLLDQGYSVSNVRPGATLPNLGYQQIVVLGKFDSPPVETAVDEATGATIQMRDISQREPAAALTIVREAVGHAGEGKASAWKPWFPVIDYDRCTNCMQCLSFCLFGVYGVTPKARSRFKTNQTARPIAPRVLAFARKSRSCSRNTKRARSTATK